MTMELIRKWTCDWCYTTTETPGTDQPKGWRRIITTYKPLANPLETDEIAFDEHICPDCVDDVSSSRISASARLEPTR